MISPTEGRSGRQAGFTLIELIVVLVILGLAIGLVVSRGAQRSPTVEARSAATRVMQGLRAARSQAIAANGPVLFTLDQAGHAFRIGRGPTQRLPADLALTLLVGGRAGRAIAFAGDGSSTGGEVRLGNRQRQMLVSVDWLSGRIGVTDATPP